MDAQSVSAAGTMPASGASADKATPQSGWPSFHEILSALNPLQYVPVVGTIYRAITGDTIPEALRIAGSFVVSALTGGPIGMILNAATIIAEKVTGIDPEAIARDLFGTAAPGPKAASAGLPTPIQEAGTPVPDATPWTASQIAAYAGEAAMPPAVRPETTRSRSQVQPSQVQLSQVQLSQVQLSQGQHLAGIASYRRSLLT